MLYKLAIAFSTGLLSLGLAQIAAGTVPVQLLNAVTGDKVAIINIGTLPYDLMIGIVFNASPYPQGTTDTLAFQLFNTSAALLDYSIQVTVDGILSDMDCETAKIHVDEWSLARNYNTGSMLYTNQLQRTRFITPSCTMWNVSIVEPSSAIESNRTSFYWAQFTSGSCDNSTVGERRRLVLTAGEAAMGNTTKGPVYTMPGPIPEINETMWRTYQNRTVIRSTQLICTPLLKTQQVMVALNSSSNVGNQYQVKTVVANPESGNSQISSVSPWDIVDSQKKVDSFI